MYKKYPLVHDLEAAAYIGTQIVYQANSIEHYSNSIMALRPSRYYKLNDSVGSISAKDFLGNEDSAYQITAVNEPTFGEPGFVYETENDSVLIDGANSEILIFRLANFVWESNNMSASFHIQTTDSNVVLACVRSLDYGTSFLEISIDATGNLVFQDSGGVFTYGVVNDGNIHSIGFKFGYGGDGGSTYLDGAKVGDEVLSSAYTGTRLDDLYMGGNPHGNFSGRGRATFNLSFMSLFDYRIASTDFERIHNNAVATAASSLVITVANNYSSGQSLAQTISMLEKIQELPVNAQRAFKIMYGLIASSVSHIEVVTVLKRITKLIENNLNSTENINSKFNILENVSSGLSSECLAYLASSIVVSDQINSSELTTTLQKLITQYNESISQTDSVTPTMRFLFLSQNHVDQAELATNNHNSSALIDSSIAFTGAISDGTDNYTFVLNSKNMALSEYTGYNFNSMYGNKATSLTGIYKLNSETTDIDSFESIITSGVLDLGSGNHKQVHHAYIGLTNSGNMLLKVKTMKDGKEKTRSYKISKTTGSVDTRRVSLGKGVKSNLWQFSLTNINNSEFDIRSIEITPLQLHRKI
jgi:hypothetical protein